MGTMEIDIQRLASVSCTACLALSYKTYQSNNGALEYPVLIYQIVDTMIVLDGMVMWLISPCDRAQP